MIIPIIFLNFFSLIKVLNNKSDGSQSSESLECSPIDVLNALRAHKWTISNEEQVMHDTIDIKYSQIMFAFILI